jgi:hypothetical protein
MLSTVFRRGLATSTRALAAAPAASAAATPASVYPFAAQAKLDTTPRALDPALKAGKGLMLHLQRTLPPRARHLVRPPQHRPAHGRRDPVLRELAPRHQN